jgi:hypothetical protein
MSAGAYNFTLEQGTTFVREIVYRDANGALVNLSGYSARMQIRPYKDSPDVLVSATTDNGKLEIVGAAGKITLTLTPSDTNSIEFAQGVYDLEIESGGGVVTRLLEGTVTFNKQVTR